MNQSETINELACALSKAQGEMQAAIKDKVNPFFKSSYADLGSVWDAARPVLSKYGLCVMQTTEITCEGSRIVMVTTLAHTSGQWVKSFLPLNPAKNDSQGVGAAITYLRRYSLSAIVGVVCDDDDDGETACGRGKSAETKSPQPQNANPAPQAASSGDKVGKAQIVALTDLIKNLDDESSRSFMDWIKKAYNAVSLTDLPKDSFEKCMASLNNKIKYINDKNKQQQIAVA
jgi:hypothetical protein